MSLPHFPLVDWFAAAEGRFDLSLSHTDCEPLTVRDLLDEESLVRFTDARLSYQPFAGMVELRDAVARTYSTIGRDDVLVCNGTSEPIYTFLRSFLSVGDEVVVPQPLWHPLHTLAREIGCHIVDWPTDDPYECRFSVDRLAELCSQRTKLIVINFPHNPTGQLISEDELREVADIARSSNAVLLSDEAFRLLELSPHETLPAVCDIYERGVSLTGLSKPHGLGGLRIGWLATRDAQIIDAAKRYRFYTTEMTNMPAQWLAVRALAQQEVIVERNRQRIAENLVRLQELVESYSQYLDLVIPHAGTMAILRQRTGLSSVTFCERLLGSQRLSLVPGDFTGLPSDTLRLGLGRADFAAALDRLDAFLNAQSATL